MPDARPVRVCSSGVIYVLSPRSRAPSTAAMTAALTHRACVVDVTRVSVGPEFLLRFRTMLERINIYGVKQ